MDRDGAARERPAAAGRLRHLPPAVRGGRAGPRPGSASAALPADGGGRVGWGNSLRARSPRPAPRCRRGCTPKGAEPARPATMSSRRDLVFVSAGLGLDGGGRAAAGRLLAGACAAFARERGIGFRLLSLDGDGTPGLEVPARGFGGDQRALAFAVWRKQIANREAAYVFDLLGPARVQSFVPAALRAPYLLPLYGIEVWRPLDWDRRRALARATARFAISAHTLERALPFCPDLGGTAVVPLALEEREPAGEADAGLLDRLGRGFLLIAGRMASGERYKGHDQLLEALP